MNLDENDTSIFFICSKCQEPAFEIPFYNKDQTIHKKCKDIEVKIQSIKKELDKSDPTKPTAKIYFDGDVIVIDHPFNPKLNADYHKFYAFKWNKEKRRREIKKDKVNSISAQFLTKDIQNMAPMYNWNRSADVQIFLDNLNVNNPESQNKIKSLNELKRDCNNTTDVSHLKIDPYGYQKAGIAFLEEIGGVGLIGDQMGLGKCSINSTTYTDLGVFPIEDLFALAAKNEAEKTDIEGGEWFTPKKTLNAYSLTKNGTIEKRKITHLYRQQVDTVLKKVHLSDGSSIKITQPHKLLTLTGWTNSFKPNDWILIPKIIPGEQKNIDLNIIHFFAWLISKGDEYNEKSCFQIIQKDKAILEKTKKATEFYFKNNKIKGQCTIRENTKDKYSYLNICSKDFFNHLNNLGYITGRTDEKKEIPQLILMANDKAIKLFLKNYFESVGIVSIDKSRIEITASSEKMMEQLAFLLRRFGIWLRYSLKENSYMGIIEGSSLITFYKEIGFYGKKKRNLLKEINTKKYNDFDVIPTIDVFSEIDKILKLSNINLGIDDVYLKTKNCSRSKLKFTIKKIDRVLSGKMENKNKTLNKIKLKLLRDVLFDRLTVNAFYAKVKKIEHFNYKGPVYDISVEDTHNYIANNIYSHNTIQAIGYTSKNNLKTIIVTLASIKFNWKNEVEKFSDKKAIVIDKGFTKDELKKYDYFITNYEQLPKWFDVLNKMKFDCVILDESHSISNISAKRTKNVFKLFKGIKHRILLSGTPSKNRPLELYSQLKFLKPKEFPNKNDFGMRYCSPTQGFGGYLEFKGASNLDELNERMAPFYIRRLKEDVLKDLPEKRVSNLVYELEPAQRKEYSNLTKDFMLTPENRYDKNKAKGHLIQLMKNCSKAKVPYLIEFITEMLQEDPTRIKKVVVFAHFRETQQMLKNHFKDIAVSLFGDDSAEDRQAAVDKFQTDPDTRIFICSTKAAGTGITLTAADTVVFADLLWTPSDHAQAEDRLHRIGQKNTVFVYYMTFANTIENLVWKTLQNKRLVVSQAVGDLPFNEDAMIKEIITMVIKSIKSD